METKVEQLEEQAMALPVKDRLRLAHTMLKSAPPPGQEVTEAEWEAELKRRADELDSGEAKGRDWAEVKKEVYERLGR